MNAILYDTALTAYIVATGSALGYLVGRHAGLWRFTRVTTQIGWAIHTLALADRALEIGRAPLYSFAEALSFLIWGAVLLELWVERRYDAHALPAFVLPIVLALGLGLPTGLRALFSYPPSRNLWILIHAGLALVGVSAFVFNFAGAAMYVIQERQLKGKRLGPAFYRLPSLEDLDRLTYRGLLLGFPFLTAGILLGALRASQVWTSFTFDPLVLAMPLIWSVYAVTLLGRLTGHFHGRRGAYVAIAGFCILLLSLGAGAFFHGRHGA